VSDDLSADAFCRTAQGFAKGALQAHYIKDYPQVTIAAGTALEHLAKAALVTRSPALLAELRGEDNYVDLLRLLGFSDGSARRPLHTVGLRGALKRVSAFVVPREGDRDLQTLADMRDGTIHAAMSDEVEVRLLVAFAQYADALLADMSRDRAEFWGSELGVIDALLADASNKIARDVTVKVAAAHAYYERRFASLPDEAVAIAIAMSEASDDPGGDQVPADCPACDSLGLAMGTHDVDWEPDEWEGDKPVNASGTVFFVPSVFECNICRLRLDSAAEIEAAGMEPRWEVEGADPLKYMQPADLSSFEEYYRDRY